MIAAGYTMHIYCDNQPCKAAKFVGDAAMSELYGQIWGECKRAAQKIGWKIGRDNQRASCPICNGKDRRLSFGSDGKTYVD